MAKRAKVKTAFEEIGIAMSPVDLCKAKVAAAISRHLQVTDYNEAFVLDLPNRFDVDFFGETDFGYAGDFVHNYSFCNLCLRKRQHPLDGQAVVSTEKAP